MTPRPHRRRSSKENRARHYNSSEVAASRPLRRSVDCFARLIHGSVFLPPMTGISPMATHHVIQAALQSAVDDGVFPGAQLAVRLRGELQCVAVAGRLSSEPPGLPVQPSTIYDLASLTKPLATVTSVLLLIQRAKVALEDSVQQVLAELEGTPIGQATVRDLLTHRSGLPGWRPLYERLDARGIVPGLSGGNQPVKQHVLKMIRDEPLIYARGERSVYSDLGFMLLGFLVERLSGMALDLWCEEAIVRPLRADPLMFCPAAGRAQLDVDTPNCRCITHSPDRTGRVAQSTLTWGGARRECRSNGWRRGPCRVIRDCRIGAGCLRSLAPRLSWKRVDSGGRACQAVYDSPRICRSIELGVGMGHSVCTVLIGVLFFRAVVRASRLHWYIAMD